MAPRCSVRLGPLGEKMMLEKITAKRSRKVNQSNVKLPPFWSEHLRSIDKSNNERQEGFYLSGKNRELASYLVQLINGAKESVVMSSFLLADTSLEDAIFEAASRGIRVYIMLACETRLEGEVPDDDFGKMCLEQHVKMLKRLGGKVLFRSAPHFHSKIVLVDALNTSNNKNAKGILFTGNLTKEAFERNEELAVILENKEIIESVQLLKWAMFEYAEHEMIDEDNFTAIQPLGEVEFPTTLERIVCTSPHQQSIREQLLKIVKDSKQELIVSSFGWQEDHEVVDAICDKARAGVRVKILSRIRPASMPALINLAKSGAQILGYKWLHAKAIWNERNEGMLMSANLQEHGLDEGFEIGLLLKEDRARQLKICLESLQVNASSHIQRLHLGSTLGAYMGDILYWQKNKLNKVSVQPSIVDDLGDVEATCITELDIEPKLPKFSWKEHPARMIEYRWQVLPPSLPAKSKEIYWEEEALEQLEPNSNKSKKNSNPKMIKHSYTPKVFQTGCRVMIAINDLAELQGAKQLKLEKFATADIVLTTRG